MYLRLTHSLLDPGVFKVGVRVLRGDVGETTELGADVLLSEWLDGVLVLGVQVQEVQVLDACRRDELLKGGK